MIAYSHIPKAGGSTLNYLLRAHFGASHLDVEHRCSGDAINRLYRERDLRFDLRIHPPIRSVAGHWLKPYVDFGSIGEDMKWYTFLREPTSRSLSQYIQDLELKRLPSSTSFGDWAKMKYFGDRNRNAQVRQICGEESSKTAVKIVRELNIFVGILESYDLSLLAWRASLELPLLSLNYSSPKNVRRESSLLRYVIESQKDLDRHLMEHNGEDLAFYRYVKDTRFPEAVEALGGRKFLESTPKGKAMKGNVPRWTNVNRLYRNMIYKPIVKIDRFVNLG